MAKTPPLQTANTQGLLPILYHGGVEFIVLGGAAAIAHGLARHTQDVDVVYSRDAANIRRLIKAVVPIEPYLRDAPLGLPFRFDEGTVRLGMNFTLTTTLGFLDLLGHVTGGGLYEDILPHSEIIDLSGLPIRFVKLDYLIHLKRAAGRGKDFEMLAQLEALKEERLKRQQP